MERIGCLSASGYTHEHMRRHLRRSISEPRIEMMPMIDVIFLLLTFFIYAMVLMVRAYLLPVELPGISQAEGVVAPVKAVSITLDSEGRLFLDTEPVGDARTLIEKIREVRAKEPDTRIYLAADVNGTKDRLPTFIDLVNRLRSSGLDEFFIVGKPMENEPPR